MGLALGRIGLSRTDFESLTLPMFEAVLKSYSEGRDMMDRGAWERLRILAAITVQPHTKKRITAKGLIPLPWDTADKPRVSREEARKRFVELLKARRENGEVIKDSTRD